MVTTEIQQEQLGRKEEGSLPLVPDIAQRVSTCREIIGQETFGAADLIVFCYTLTDKGDSDQGTINFTTKDGMQYSVIGSFSEGISEASITRSSNDSDAVESTNVTLVRGDGYVKRTAILIKASPDEEVKYWSGMLKRTVVTTRNMSVQNPLSDDDLRIIAKRTLDAYETSPEASQPLPATTGQQ